MNKQHEFLLFSMGIIGAPNEVGHHQQAIVEVISVRKEHYVL